MLTSPMREQGIVLTNDSLLIIGELLLMENINIPEITKATATISNKS
jgi:hypothetical protein